MKQRRRFVAKAYNVTNSTGKLQLNSCFITTDEHGQLIQCTNMMGVEGRTTEQLKRRELPGLPVRPTHTRPSPTCSCTRQTQPRRKKTAATTQRYGYILQSWTRTEANRDKAVSLHNTIRSCCGGYHRQRETLQTKNCEKPKPNVP